MVNHNLSVKTAEGGGDGGWGGDGGVLSKTNQETKQFENNTTDRHRHVL